MRRDFSTDNPPVTLLFGLALFVSAVLVFLVQPMTAKLLLPTFGGSPQVWTAATLFFQAALLAGYAYSDLAIRRLGLRRQPLVHIAFLLLPIVVLPIALRGIDSIGSLSPAVGVLLILTLSVGLPYVAVATTSPLLQRWFSASGHRLGRDPYFLYAAGNVGSMLGLLGYPLLIEPRLTVAGQSALWSAGYVTFAGLCIACAVVLLRRPGVEDQAAAPVLTEYQAAPVSVSETDRERPVTSRRRLGWVARAFIPSSLMLGVTTFSSTDIAAVPLLWVVPLSLYLLTFVIAFARRRLVSVEVLGRVLPITMVLAFLTIIEATAVPIWARIAVHYANFFCAALLAHTQLADDRPAPSELTRYFLLLAIGGALGGVANALIAPVIFDAVLEYPLVLVAALLLRRDRPGTVHTRRSRYLDLLVPAAYYLGLLLVLVALNRLAPDTALAGAVVPLAVLATLLLARRPVRFALAVGGLLTITFLGGQQAVFADRSFFGVNRVIDDGEGRHVYLNGGTVHGAQRMTPGERTSPITYYHPTGPAGDVFRALQAERPAADVAIIGLGAGGLAPYGASGQHFTFVDIDPVVIRIATDPALFTYLEDSAARITVAEGDGRLWIAGQPAGRFDVIVLDAFSSDAVPAHLITREAVELYLTRLRPGGFLMFNVTNSYLDVRSVVAGAASSLGLSGRMWMDRDTTSAPDGDKQPSEWVVLASDPETVRRATPSSMWQALAADRRILWTDDFSDVLGVLR